MCTRFFAKGGGGQNKKGENKKKIFLKNINFSKSQKITVRGILPPSPLVHMYESVYLSKKKNRNGVKR